MTFGLVFLDENGATWTVGPIPGESPGVAVGLRFCRPNFFEPLEEIDLRPLPAGWPTCTAEEFRDALALARGQRPG